MAPKGPRKSTKTEVELVRAQADLERAHNRAEAIRGAVRVLQVVVAAVPIYAFGQVIEPLAGQETLVEANVVVSITLVASLVGNATQLVQGRTKARTVRELRARADRLEQENKELKGQ